MSVKRGVTKSKFVAKLVTEEKGPCAFCQRDVDDELIYGKLYAIGSIKCHYFCVLLSCCMVQRGRDEDGLFGFLYPDILAEIERSKKHKCSYCNKEGATLGCSISQCRKQFHLPCGREKNAVSLFYGSYKSFCQNHTPKQKIAEDVMAKAKVRLQADRRRTKLEMEGLADQSETSEPESVCVICYEPVQGYPTIQTFWPPCCARDAWFHRTCLQRMALSAGMHYLKCPLCNDKENFYDAVVSQGYYVPDRDAAWELEQNAFADIYERPLHCHVEDCKCPMGREHDSDSGMWDIKLCLLCGSSGAHAHCLSILGETRLICALCRAANTDVEHLADTIEAAIVTEQAQIARSERRPVMPSRMSLRRTKQRIMNSASSSRCQETTIRSQNETASSREDLNLKTPKRPQPDRTHILKDIQNKYMSPSKMIEQLYEKISVYDVDSRIVDEVKDVFRKPKPLSVKKKIVDNILDNIVNNIVKENIKSKEPIKEWCSPKKSLENTTDIAFEDTIKRKWSKEAVNSPYKSPIHTPKKFTDYKAQSPYKSPKTTPKTMEHQEDIAEGITFNRTPKKDDKTPNIDELKLTLHCHVEDCKCPMGREHDSDSGMWDIKLCLLCGSSGAHAHCLSILGETRLICALCRAANTDVEHLADTIEAAIVTEQAQIARSERRPVMPSRMSLRRTKQRIMNSASSSRCQETTIRSQNETASSREDLNLKTPKRPQPDRTHILKDIQNKYMSPSKMIEQLYEKISVYDIDGRIVDEVKDVFRKPKPLSVKKKIVDNILDNIVNNIVKENIKSKEPIKEWCSPKKSLENTTDIAFEDTIKRKWSKEAVNSPYKSPIHTPKKFTDYKAQSPYKSPKTTPKTMEHQEDIAEGITFNRTPKKDDKTPNIDELKPEKITSDDESSSSTFQLPSEFIADDSNDSLPIFETPKLKTVDIQKDSSLEISENDEVVKVDVVKMEEMCPNNDFIKNLNIKSPVKTIKCAFKFSPVDKETLERGNASLDVECFKNRYLNEVDRDLKCKFKHNHAELPEKRSSIKTAIDFAMEASEERKRSIEISDDIPKKKRKISNGVENRKKKEGAESEAKGLKKNKKRINEKSTDIEMSNGQDNLKLSFEGKRKKKKSDKRRLKEKDKNKINETSTDIELSSGQDNLKLSLQGKEKKKKTKVSIKDKEIKVKIQWKKKKLQVRITESKVKQENPKLKQYVLKYKDLKKTMLEKPQFDVTPMKRKYVKQGKSPDNLKQMSIQSFFKVTLPKKEQEPS